MGKGPAQVENFKAEDVVLSRKTSPQGMNCKMRAQIDSRTRGHTARSYSYNHACHYGRNNGIHKVHTARIPYCIRCSEVPY